MKRYRMILCAAAAAMLALSALPAAADSGSEADHDVIAGGLNNPRHLSFAPNGDLYIAEAGRPTGDKGNCFRHPGFGTDVCLNFTGSITKLTKHGAQSRVVTALPALANGQEMTGPSDVLVHGSTLTVVVGLGASADNRAELGEAGRLLGTVIDVKQSGAKPTISVRADLSAFEDSDPDGAGVDSNPVDLATNGRDLIAVDAGGNSVLAVGKKGGADLVTALPPAGVERGFQSVPTGAAIGPDGAWYVGELTGFPFPAGASTVWRIDPSGAVTPYATGLSNVTDLAWHGDRLYVVQVADEGFPDFFNFSGSLVAVDPEGNHETIADNLFAPYGIAIRDNAAYVTTGSVAAGAGQVIRVPLS